ncbi:hypothetical protein A1O1_08893 [Capronia coronata CBS 617.96]|uniref:Uncharacterized protein n=1 Tax=Capronia coronata CBS 617.96 TaxID=1182541 RepID=W9XDE6_9EURO|nr:uncharacterized protein A1O1_08893 [Capronia coronata CBS 617.96]EXJ78492.1 hypothetical protein A1O1_08893 [Capronia coronata CBS 617.96]
MPSNLSVNGEDLSGCSFSTVQVNGLFTPLSYQPINDPQLEELFTPLDELPGPERDTAYETQPFDEHSWLGHGQSKSPAYSFDMCPPPLSAQSSWHFHQRPASVEVQTAPSSPDFLQHTNIDTDVSSLDNATGTTENAEELVAMGLYDSPAEVQSSSFLFGRASSERKALKLEESFEPADRDEGEEAGGDDATSEATFEYDDTPQDVLRDHAFPAADYTSQSIASHLTYGAQPEVNPMAFQYLATLCQLNSPYYPTASHGYGWV